MNIVLVNLVSDQTIPNIEFIKDMNERRVDQFLFISTKAMEKKGSRMWVLDTVLIEEERILDPLIVDPFSFKDIEEKLSSATNDNDYYLVNLTGGTKIMSLAAFEFFKDMNAEIYYLPGNGKKIKMHPGRDKTILDLEATITLDDYLSAYGFEVISQGTPFAEPDASNRLLQYFMKGDTLDEDEQALTILRQHRRKKLKLEDNKVVQSFLARLNFIPSNADFLTKYESRYLSGDWLEEYIFNFLLENFDIPESNIGLGLHARKAGVPNEFDVMLMRKNKIYLFECKTSVFHDSDESQTFIGETIYKSDSLRNKFGLFAQTTVVTLSETGHPKLANHLKRAEANRVKIIGREAFRDNTLYEALEKV